MSMSVENLGTRRAFLMSATAGGVAGLSVAAASAAPGLEIAIFSKHLHWAKWDEMAAFAAEAGFDGVDLTVRGGGHVLPERVRDDLPRAFEAVRKAGLKMPMITAGIVDVDSPHAAAILETASELGIRYYRWGGFKYDDSKPIPEQLKALRGRVKKLAELNRRHGMTAIYHTHSGLEVGAPVWDLWEILRGFDSRLVGINYDIAHATVEGGYGGWIRSAQLSGPYMRGVALKDFLWAKTARGVWVPGWCPPGVGMVNFDRFFAMLKGAGFAGPVQVHYEYQGLGGADAGKTTLSISKADLLGFYIRDLRFYREKMRAAGI
jgi:L-ribulose-5-phosphate 3-epimerase